MKEQPSSGFLASVRRFFKSHPSIGMAVTACIAVLALVAALAVNVPVETPQEETAKPTTPTIPQGEVTHAPGTVEAKLSALRKLVFADKNIDDALKQSMGYANKTAPFAVFFSVSDGKTKARVVSGVGQSMAEAWLAAESALSALGQREEYRVVWIKADVVNHMEQVAAEDLPKHIEPCRENGFTYGIAMDDGFEMALLEAEISAAEIIDYETDTLNLPNANIYLANADRKGISMLSDNLLLFTTKGYFCDGTDTAYPLATDRVFQGQRTPEDVDKEDALSFVESSVDFLLDNMEDNGQFLYGYYPANNRRQSGYNLMRHSEAIWALCLKQAQSKTASLQLSIDKAIAHLESQVQVKDNRAFVCQTEANEIHLGGNAMAVVALTAYADVFETERYDKLIEQLADGILYMQQEDGGFCHLWNAADLTEKADSYSGYYDGQATFALARAYTRTKEVKYMVGMRKAADWMIANNYGERNDQWVTYAMNELTLHLPHEEYFKLGLQPVIEGLSALKNVSASAPYYFELLTTSYEMRLRLEEKNLFPTLQQQVDKAALAEAIKERAKRTLVGRFVPETAMYMEYPARVMHQFYKREDRFRIRLDDLQQSICGYTAYAQLCDQWNSTKG